MVQIVQQRDIGEDIGKGIGTALSTLGEKLAQHRSDKKESDALEKLRSGWSAETTPEEKAFDVMQDSNISAETKKSIPKLFSDMAKKKQQEWSPEKQKELSSAFQGVGVDEEKANNYANLYGQLTTGGQTEAGKILLDNVLRDGNLGEKQQAKEPQKPTKLLGEEVQYEYPDLDVIEGLTPKEKASYRKDLAKSNTIDYQASKKTLKSLKTDGEAVEQLGRLSASGKLPENIGRVNLDKHGYLKVPFLANEQSQLYVKTINGFIKNARESFGAKVTNFELDAFMQQLPTLSLSPEGRTLVLAQMDNINKRAQLKLQAEKAVYDKYGLSNVDIQKLDSISDDMISEKNTQLEQEFSDIVNKSDELIEKANNKQGVGFDKNNSPANTEQTIVSKLPSPSTYKGYATDDKTGKRYYSDGVNWSEAK